MDDKYKYTYEETSEYCYPNTGVLINKLNITNDKDLYEAEMELVAYSTTSLVQTPIKDNFDFNHLKKIHQRLFEKVYDWAGTPRTCAIAKKDLFCLPQYIDNYANIIFNKLKKENYFLTYDFDKKISCLVELFAEVNALHPFREGNGRTQREFIEELAKINGINLDLTGVDKMNMIIASHESINGDYDKLTMMFNKCSRALSKENQIDYIELYCSKDLRKKILKLL
ncbi:MAG: Fic family protein [Bacilli bacterium]|nr:Fic family protein [Bacilli bacterium]MDD4795533.1 Fic family protein [Bacilli bacterium]